MSARSRVSFIAFFPARDNCDERKPSQIAESFAENLGKGWKGILLVPGGKATVQLRKQLAALGNERGFAVFASEPQSDGVIVSQRILRAANGIYVSNVDIDHPVRGYAELQGITLSEY